MQRMLTALIVLVCLSLVPLVGVAPATVQAECTGEGCDPGGTSCERDARTVPAATAFLSDGYIELRYSPSCGTIWSRVTATTLPQTALQVWLERYDQSGRIYQEGGSSYRWWTAMRVDSRTNGIWYRACGSIRTSSNYNCTAYFD